MTKDLKDIVEDKVGGSFNILDALTIVGMKVGSEEFLARVPYVGNGTLRSGAIKLGGAILVSMISKKKLVQYEATALLLDSAEDLIAGVRSMRMNASSQTEDDFVQIL